MSFEDALNDLSARATEYAGALATEEATKNAIIMPFISRVLGYDVFNPAEVVPEFICDVGTKKGEKIDYAITRDGEVQMLIEAKKIGEPLALSHASQLIRYFSVSNARVAVLTNGQFWHFFTDLDKPNVMDERPFLRLDLLNIDAYALPELKKLTKDAFDIDSVLAAAEELKYVSALKAELGRQFAEPDEDFVRLFATRVYGGALTAKMRDFFKGVTDKALKQYVNERVNDRLKTALGAQGTQVMAAPEVDGSSQGPDAEELQPSADSEGSLIETTEAELQGYMIVRAIVASEVPVQRVVQRDQQSYFSVLLDDNNRKPICRLHFNGKSKKYIGLFDAHRDQTRHELNSIEDIYQHADQIRTTVRSYLGADA